MNFFSNLKIGTRLAWGFGLVLALLGVITTLAVQRLHAIDGMINLVVTDRYAKVVIVNAVQDEVTSQALSISNAIIGIKNPDEVKASLAQAQKASENNSALLDKLKGMVRTAKGQEHFRAVTEARAPYAQARDELAKLVQEGKAEEAGVLMLGKVRPLQASYLKAIDTLDEYQSKSMDSDAAAADETASSAIVITLALAGVALVAGAGIAVVTSRSITRPLQQAVTVAQQVAEGNLSVRIDSTTRDETGQLLHALHQMVDSLAGIVGQVRQSSESIATGAAQIATGNADLSQRTEEQASNLQQTAASMEQLTGTVRNNADTARQANQMADSASLAATQGGQVVNQVVSTMQDIATSSKKIADIIGVIDGIAFQTNILALNAAVEAARAGEQGRGFAVVASEVRSLAQRSATAAKEIKTLINESVEKVDAGAHSAAEAGKSMDEIVTRVKRVNDLIAEISHATGEQSTGIGQVGEAVQQLDQVTQQNAALVEESAAAAESLRHQASRMVEVVGVFKLGQGPSAQAPALQVARHAAPQRLAPSAKPAAPRAKPAPVPAKAEPVATASADHGDWETF
ncbi:MAG: MCP four helix bundle domain-containing protein [Ideonella sp.]|nr:MCP four helix bundle domain-containing protein [Ideonella sp.]